MLWLPFIWSNLYQSTEEEAGQLTNWHFITFLHFSHFFLFSFFFLTFTPPQTPCGGGTYFFSNSIICHWPDIWYFNDSNLRKFVVHKTFLSSIAKRFIESSIFFKKFRSTFLWKSSLFRRNLYVLQWFEIRTFRTTCLKTYISNRGGTPLLPVIIYYSL